MTPPKHHREAVIRHIGEDGSIYVGVPSANDDPVIRLSPEFLDAVMAEALKRWMWSDYAQRMTLQRTRSTGGCKE